MVIKTQKIKILAQEVCGLAVEIKEDSRVGAEIQPELCSPGVCALVGVRIAAI